MTTYDKFYHRIPKDPQDMTISELDDEMEACADFRYKYKRICVEIGQGIQSKENLRERKVRAELNSKEREKLMPTFLVEDLIEEIRIAADIIENHHVNCEWMAEPDLDAEESESCAEFAEQFGTGYDRLTCHDHDKLREWSKMLADEIKQ